jgi:hypothetical protein
VAFSDASQFLQNYLLGDTAFSKGNSFMDRPDLIAATVAAPDMNPDGSFKRHQDGDKVYSNRPMDYPDVPVQSPYNMGSQDNPYTAFGVFGLDPADTIDRGQIRGRMQFIPGGIPASPGFNYEQTLKQYPEQMQGVKKGDMPIYGTPR